MCFIQRAFNHKILTGFKYAEEAGSVAKKASWTRDRMVSCTTPKKSPAAKRHCACTKQQRASQNQQGVAVKDL
jgi:hypothetical protein